MALNESIYYMNQLLKTEYELSKTYPKTAEELVASAFKNNGKFFKKFYNIKSPKDGKFSKIDKKYIRSEKNKNGIDEQLAQIPCIVTPYYITYYINSFKNECRKFDLENPENSDCWFTVDLNWYEKPNTLFVLHNSSENRLYYTDGDQFILVIKHSQEDDNKLVPALLPKYNPRIIKKSKFEEIIKNLE